MSQPVFPSRLALLLTLVWILPCAAARQQGELGKWIDGPVRYLAVKDEVKRFRALETDEERTVFIERFWSRRDPTPETLTNEYRQLFWERVQQANSNFTGSTKEGWLTDRGKIHILYGPPTEIQEDIHIQTQGLPTGGRGLIRWIYEGRPAGRMDLDTIVVVPFVGDGSGEYRLSYDPTLSSVFFDWTTMREKTFGQRMMEKFLDRGAGFESELSVMLDLGRMQEVPPHEQLLLERVETMETYNTRPLPVRVDRYFEEQAQSSIAVITVDLREIGGIEKPAIIARLTPDEATKQPRLLGEDSFRVEKRDGLRLAQGRVRIDSGSYSVTVMVADPAQIATAVYRGRLNVPRAADRLRFSDVVWAAELEPLPYAALASHTEPFIVGPFRVLPRMDAVFRPGETLKLFFEVYGGSPPLEVAYQVEGRDLDGSWVRLGRPQTVEQSASGLGWELTTSSLWPSGEYRVAIEVRDEAERWISTQVSFSLASPGPS